MHEIGLRICRFYFHNLFLADVPILYPLETPENQMFSGVFRGYKTGKLARKGLSNIITK